MQARLAQSGGGRRHLAEQPVRKVAPQHGADLRDFARFAEPVEPRGQRLLQGRRNRLCAALRVALEQEPRHLFDEQRHAARSLAHSIDHLLGERMPACDLADHAPHLRAVERRERTTPWGERMAQGAGIPAAWWR